jgi:hypothetical protein
MAKSLNNEVYLLECRVGRVRVGEQLIGKCRHPSLLSLGAQVIEGRGSRIRFVLNGQVGTFHRPHPAKKAKPYQAPDARAFLDAAGVKP